MMENPPPCPSGHQWNVIMHAGSAGYWSAGCWLLACWPAGLLDAVDGLLNLGELWAALGVELGIPLWQVAVDDLAVDELTTKCAYCLQEIAVHPTTRGGGVPVPLLVKDGH